METLRAQVEHLLATRQVRFYGATGIGFNRQERVTFQLAAAAKSDERVANGLRIALPYMDERGLRAMVRELEKCPREDLR